MHLIHIIRVRLQERCRERNCGAKVTQHLNSGLFNGVIQLLHNDSVIAQINIYDSWYGTELSLNSLRIVPTIREPQQRYLLADPNTDIEAIIDDTITKYENYLKSRNLATVQTGETPRTPELMLLTDL